MYGNEIKKQMPNILKNYLIFQLIKSHAIDKQSNGFHHFYLSYQSQPAVRTTIMSRAPKVSKSFNLSSK